MNIQTLLNSQSALLNNFTKQTNFLKKVYLFDGLDLSLLNDLNQLINQSQYIVKQLKNEGVREVWNVVGKTLRNGFTQMKKAS